MTLFNFSEIYLPKCPDKLLTASIALPDIVLQMLFFNFVTNDTSMMERTFALCLMVAACLPLAAQYEPLSKGGATQRTLSKSEYFSWMNNTWESSTEAQTMRRSGPTVILEAQAAREASFEQKYYKGREAECAYMFDGDTGTSFSGIQRFLDLYALEPSFFLDLGRTRTVDSVAFDIPDMFSLQPYSIDGGDVFYVSNDLCEWYERTFTAGCRTVLDCSGLGGFRYLRLPKVPLRVCEINVYKVGKVLPLKQ